MDPDKLDSLMILVCAVALVILAALAIYTWVRWHQKQTQALASNDPDPPGIELTGVTPTVHYQKGYLNEIGRVSPNLSGSRTFLNDDVLKQKPFPKDAKSTAQFETKDVVYHADAGRHPNELMAGDVVFHSNGPSVRVDNETTATDVVVAHVVYNVDETSGKRRWSESMARTSDINEAEVSHRKNTYL